MIVDNLRTWTAILVTVLGSACGTSGDTTSASETAAGVDTTNGDGTSTGVDGTTTAPDGVTTSVGTTDPGVTSETTSTSSSPTATSTPAAECGDGDVDDGEECDEGRDNGAPSSTCTAKCKLNVCGDGVRGPGEECDEGSDNGDTEACTSACVLAECGDGLLGPKEQCDDGNDDPLDGCTHECRLPICGDGIVSATEGCDDGNTEDFDGCDATCQLESCGDGYVDPGEDCDDFKDGDNDDACTDFCKLPKCGDGLLQASKGEECDDANAIDTDDCISDCRLAECGDGIVRASNEDCDDANDDWDDGCTPTCHIPGRVFVTSTTYDGNLGNNAGAQAKCVERANAAGLGGNWDAWVSAGDSPNTRFDLYSAYARLDGVVIAQQGAHIFNGNLIAPINRDEFDELLDGVEVWTSTNTIGNDHPINVDVDGCKDFTMNHPAKLAGYGISSATNADRTQLGTASCAQLKHLYCFEQP